MDNKLVTVVIPTYSRPKHLIRAINSVLDQTYSNIEIIVVDDNGEGTPQQLATENLLKNMIENNKINYVKHECNKNGSAARNTGLSMAKGEYIAFLDDDDIYMPKKIEVQAKFLDTSSDIVAGCICTTANLLRNGKEEIKINKLNGNFADQIILPNSEAYIGTSKWLMKTEVCRKIGGFDTGFRRHQDMEFMMRVFRNYEICSVNPGEVLLKYDLSTSSDHPISGNLLYEVDMRFLEKFSSDYDTFGNRNDCYYYTWIEPITSLLYDKEFKKALFCMKNATKYRRISNSEYYIFLKTAIKGIIKWKR